MKTVSIFLCFIIFSFSLFAQTPEQVLATANGQKFTVQDLPPEIGGAYANLSKTVAETRKALLEQEVIETIFGLEAKSKNITIEKFLEQIKTKVPAPAEKDIQAVYEANREKIGSRSLAEVRPQIVVKFVIETRQSHKKQRMRPVDKPKNN